MKQEWMVMYRSQPSLHEYLHNYMSILYTILPILCI